MQNQSPEKTTSTKALYYQDSEDIVDTYCLSTLYALCLKMKTYPLHFNSPTFFELQIYKFINFSINFNKLRMIISTPPHSHYTEPLQIVLPAFRFEEGLSLSYPKVWL